MAQITLCSANSWAVFQEEANSWLEAAQKPTLFLIPPNWHEQSVRNAFPGSYVLSTLELLEHYVYKKTSQNHLLLRPTIEHLLNTIIMEKTADGKSSSRYLNIETFHQGYIRALGEFILEFRENGPENLLDALSSFKKSALSAKERDLIDIYDDLENVLEQQHLYDYRRALLEFLQDKEQGKPQYFIQELAEATLVIFGFNHLTSLESKLLGRLMFRFKQTLFCYCSNEAAAAATFRCQTPISTFIANVKSVFADRLEETRVTATAEPGLMPLARLIFEDEKSERLLKNNTNSQIYGANNRFGEVTYIARQIRHLHDQGIPYDQIQVVFPAYETYASLLLEVFPRYQIPYQLITGTPLVFYPLAQTILTMVTHATVPGPFALREQIFSSSYVTFNMQVTAEILHKFIDNLDEKIFDDDTILDNLLPKPKNFTLDFDALLALQKRASRVIRAAENLKPVQKVIRYLKKLYQDEPRSGQQELFNAVVSYYVLAIAERSLYVFGSEMVPALFCRAIEKLLLRFNVEQNINLAKKWQRGKMAVLLEQDHRVLIAVRSLLMRLERQFSSLSDDQEHKIPLTDLVQAFSNMMVDPENYVMEPQKPGVAIFTTADLPLQFWPITFIGGLVDGDFPGQIPFNFLQPKQEGQPLTGDLVPVDRDRQYLYQFIASTTDQLVISYPYSDADKKTLVSPFIAEIQKCFTRLPTVESDASPMLYSRREKICYISKHVDRFYDNSIPVLQEFKKKSPNFFQQMIEIFQCDGLRGSINNFSRFDGLISSPVALKIVDQIVKDFTFNVEKLERFAGCPLRFLLDDLIRLKPEFAIDYHPDHADRGVLIRQILVAYSRMAAAKSMVPVAAREILLDAATTALQGQVEEKDDLFSHRFRRGLVMGLKLAHDNVPKRPGLLAAFLEHEITAPDLLVPFLADLSFRQNGNGENRFYIDEIPVNIEIDSVYATSNDKFLIIFNYSVADSGYLDGIHKGLRFKLPLQILALQDYVTRQKINKTVGGAGTYLVKNHRNIKRGGYFALKELQARSKNQLSDQVPIYSGQRKYGFLPEQNFYQELQIVRNRVLQIKNLIQRGRFHLPLCAPKEQICANCYFARICRIEQLRLDRLYTQVDGQETYKPLRRMKDMDDT